MTLKIAMLNDVISFISNYCDDDADKGINISYDGRIFSTY
jgi:hypothetical protein